MLELNNLQSISDKRKRVGRGGDLGGTSGRGHKGQRSRSGGKTRIKAWFEGGQMPLPRRLPKRGFNNLFKKEFTVFNLGDLEKHFSAGDVVSDASLREKKLIKGNKKVFVKVLGNGELTKKLTVEVDSFSKSASEVIKKNGGEVKLIKEL